MDSIAAICPNAWNLLWFWHIKNAENSKKWDKDEDARDSYDRLDNYNVFGISTYIFLQYKLSLAELIN